MDNLITLYLLIVNLKKKKNICLINHIEYAFIYDGILNNALINRLEKRNIFLHYYYTSDDLLCMTKEQRASIISQNDFFSLEKVNEYCKNNSVDIIKTEEFYN